MIVLIKIQSMYSDLLRLILLEANIDTVEQLCFCNKTTLSICKSKSFWRDKFRYDGLPISPTGLTIQQSLSEYRSLCSAFHLSHSIIDLMLYLHESCWLHISSLTFYPGQSTAWLPLEIREYLYSIPVIKAVYFNLITKNPDTFNDEGVTTVYYTNDRNLTFFKQHLPYRESCKLLMFFLYYFPDLKIIDNMSPLVQSVRLRELEVEILKIDLNQDIVREICQKRIDFLKNYPVCEFPFADHKPKMSVYLNVST